MLCESVCARKTYFERREPFYEVPTRCWWPVRGTLLHTVVEAAGLDELEQYGWIQEMRMAVPLKYPDIPQPELDAAGNFTGTFLDEPLVITLGGTCDAYNCITRELHDFKSMADIKVEMFVKAEQAEEKHEIQLNVYRWLIANTKTPRILRKRWPDLPKFLPPPERLVIQAIGMMDIPKSGGRFGMRVGTPGSKYKRYQEFEVAGIPVWPLEKTETFIRERALNWYRWLVLGELPPITAELVGKDGHRWPCKSCAFYGEMIPNGICFPNEEAA